MTDRYQSFSSSPIGQLFVKNLGLPNPVKLERYTPGAPLVNGTVVVGGTGRLVDDVTASLDALGVASTASAAEGEKYKGIVFDATGITSVEGLVAIQQFFTPLLRSLQASAHVVVLGTNPSQTEGLEERVAQRALEGVTRSLGKEIGKGSTVNLVYVAPGSESAITSALGFFLSPKSAYVSGQVAVVGGHGDATVPTVADWTQPLAGKVAIVTGASRGIGEQIARVLHRDGATILGIDVPQAASELVSLMQELGGDHLTLDITGKDAPQRIAHHVKQKFGGVDVVVHNAGITRDKMLRNMSESQWSSVVAVNLAAPLRITNELLDQKLVNDGGSIINLSSAVGGFAGNAGQTNYSASKYGMRGIVEGLADELPGGITVNAVAPGFIITKMTDAMPFAAREVGQRLNALAQGGLPVDIAEAAAFFANPASRQVNGNTLRVCGQMWLGA
jgi:3-oxoacyl-[acyl-carrier protein] reductase